MFLNVYYASFYHYFLLNIYISSYLLSIIDDEGLINTLQQSKITSEEVIDQLIIAEETEKKIDIARLGVCKYLLIVIYNFFFLFAQLFIIFDRNFLLLFLNLFTPFRHILS